MPAESQQPSLLPRRSAVRSGLATGFSTLAVSGSAVIAGAYLAQKFGRDAETDGFLAAYGVYLVIVLAAQAFRLVLVPDLTRATAEDRLTAEFFSYVAAFLLLAVPTCLLTLVLAHGLGEVLTGNLPRESADAAANALVWVVPAAFLQLLAAVAASALAAAQSYTVAAVGYALGALATLAIFIPLAGSQGLVSLAWGVFANGAVAFAVPFVALLRYGHLRGRRRGGIAIGPRLWRLVQAAALPLALQGLYVTALRGASGLGEGNQTSLTYAYLLAATLVAATASSLSLISSEPLTRRGLDVEGAAAHVVHASWVSLSLIGAATGVFALVGGDLVHLVLGSAFAGDVGEEIGNLVIFLAPWMVAQVSFSVTFPILFVLERPQILLPLAIGATVVHIFLTVGLRELWGLEGLAIALAVTTFGVMVVLMASVSTRMLRLAAAGIARSAIVVAAIAIACFALPALVLPGVAAAVVGVALYVGTLWLLRPRGLVESWHYVRALHQ
jgi:peptidoglycan biosynthesis protein MviN/MurJ (putative lipid II flippase)